jgi:hypothetical protein
VHHLTEGLVRPHDDVVGVQLHDPVDRGVEDEAEVLFGSLQGFVRLADALERSIRVGERRLLLAERTPHRFGRLRHGDLVRDDAHRDREREDADEQSSLQAGEPFVVAEHAGDQQGRAGRDHGDAREDRSCEPRRSRKPPRGSDHEVGGDHGER